MRFWLAVAAAAAAQAYAFAQITGPRTVPAAALAIMLLAALGAGFFARSRGALAGALSLYAGALIYAVASYVAAPPFEDAPRNALDLVGWTLRLGIAVVPYAVGAALAGLAGAYARRRMLGAWR
jgi:hypothetical protein